ncbi:pyridoxine 5'-phosphate synthase [Acetobacter pasteurianus]|uniref:Pyridoxine 5'-phosphate synthase n=1 Tax=Acetobacter pasteurianus NBRC 3278 TaxID=1226660 RepID=A0A401X5I2_ACEPA|nr:pyridoxine 5'-phosphate synthase [Acetobacter pasteurianus]BAU39320.1 pyridoxal phosphate biosynthetic protein PdxJ [Acetobacter pasteurianus NBRC 101655]CCT59136.1 pyridoxal phosphate biosynthetic protein PdxJ [Acetobacter pasteurianus 386B]GCD59433.1 pyridoxal phosphate biosynthetic protein PdxJ [Acetobacter pasteurianus NBRC 3277]GCD62938.1 pyridoxal phosphate biosynthetic protein PdxJ [Acetobacter pasteurianus NBRC 3278]GCD69311.1 pyridoxal phosphate biosynthetic protein PdxJ [Acetobact
MTSAIRLGVNIDHVATIRNARGGTYPDPVAAALLAIQAGADGITAHLREDRRHIRDKDLQRLRAEIAAPLNMEMAATEEMVGIALGLRPHACCLVPERREELTTEGGLNVAGQLETLTPKVQKLAQAGIRVSLFIDPSPAQIEAAAKTGAQVVELHTGAYAEGKAEELERLRAAATQAAALGLEVHAGHGLTFENVGPIASLPELRELNIGHFLIGQAIFDGLAAVVQNMKRHIAEGAAL